MAGRKIIDITGRRFGRLCVIEITDKRLGRDLAWRCKCECGNERLVRSASLRNGDTQSCGCLNKEVITKHGAGRDGNAHPLYSIWRNMNARCQNPNNKRYDDYGGRGITVCDTWKKSYISFRDYMLSLPNCPVNAQTPGAHLARSIDRYPNKDGAYEPGNVRWATDTEQNNNFNRNRIIRINGVDMSLQTAVNKYAKAPYETVRRRLNDGWSKKDAFLTSVK